VATTPIDIENEFRAILSPDSLRAATASDAIFGVQPRGALLFRPPVQMRIPWLGSREVVLQLLLSRVDAYTTTISMRKSKGDVY
jgi:hypothetical protein